jgi:general secretion pathway protein E/type IV pilus assembly protein PilB
LTSNDEYVLEILREKGVVTVDQVQSARDAVANEGETAVDVLLTQGVITESSLLSVLASQFGMEMMSLENFDVPSEVRDMISVETARKYRVVPLYKTDDTLTIALSDPLASDAIDNLRYTLKCNVEGVVVTREDMKAALDKFYSVESTMESMLGQMTDGTVDINAAGTAQDVVVDESNTNNDAPIIKLVSLIILEAYRNRASDIHLEPLEKRFRIRYRIDGVLQEVDSPPKRLQSSILSRVKIMADMKISEKRTPQDGRIQVNVLGRELDLRVSSVPTNHGESIVMRILDKQSLALGLPKLGFLADDQATFERLIGLPDGILLVTGPTGSGKTTTLYAVLGEINLPDRKIITVEDPVEYQMSGINQVQVREAIGMTFSAALRSILRQAPNVIMIGEIRDKETALIAIESSLTGHLVFSTLHTNDAPSAVTRLLDIGVKPFLVASSLRAAMAQRLVRTICEDCKEEYNAAPEELTLLGASAQQGSDVKLYRGHGCANCNLTGFKGRKGIFEMFVVDDEIRKMIFEKVTASKLRSRAREVGMRTLREDGLRKVLAGITTLPEVMRVTMGDVD